MIGLALIALPWLLPWDSGEYVRCTQCLKYHQACSRICPACLAPDSAATSGPRYARILTARTHGMRIQLLLAVVEFLICVMQCALPCLIIGSTVSKTGLPASYGIDWNAKLAFVLMIVPSAACWYAFLGSRLRGEQSYSPTRPMMFRPMLIANGASALLLEDGRPLVAYGVGTICNVVLFTISCCVAPCTFGTFQHVPRGGYSIDPATNAMEISHEPSGFSIASVLDLAQSLLDDLLR